MIVITAKIFRGKMMLCVCYRMEIKVRVRVSSRMICMSVCKVKENSKKSNSYSDRRLLTFAMSSRTGRCIDGRKMRGSMRCFAPFQSFLMHKLPFDAEDRP